MTYDAMLAPALLSKDGPMQRYIAAEPDHEKQARMGEYLQRFLTGPSWTDTLGTMMQIARTRAMQPDYFREAVLNAVRDPSGVAMLNWLDKKIVRSKPDPDEIQNLASVFFLGVKRPSIDSTAFNQWAGVYQKLKDYGYTDSKMLTDDGATALRALSARRGKPLKPELSGGPMLREAVMAR